MPCAIHKEKSKNSTGSMYIYNVKPIITSLIDTRLKLVIFLVFYGLSPAIHTWGQGLQLNEKCLIIHSGTHSAFKSFNYIDKCSTLD